MDDVESTPTPPGNVMDPAVLTALFGGIADAVLVLDASARVVWTNPALLSTFGYARSDLEGRGVEPLFGDSAAPALSALARDCSEAPGTACRLRTMRLLRKSGEVIEAEVTPGPIAAAGPGQPCGLILIIHDLHSARRKEAVLAKLNAASADHNLRGDEKIGALLDLGRSYLELPDAEVVVLNGDACRVAFSVSDGPGPRPVGTDFNLQDSLSARIVATRSPLALNDVPRIRVVSPSGASGAETAETARAYIGAELRLESKVIGTVSFSAPTARDPFLDLEIEVVELIAAWISQEIFIGLKHERLSQEAQTDWLTSARNRRAFMPQMVRALDDHRAVGMRSSLILLDLDHFKQVNDLHGHPAGDCVLRVAVDRIKTVCRKHDCIGRLGGEEFGVLVAGMGLAEAEKMAERMRAAISNTPIYTSKAELKVTASFGIAEAEAGFTHATEWLSAADEALYAAKQGGRDRVALREPQVLPIVSRTHPARRSRTDEDTARPTRTATRPL